MADDTRREIVSLLADRIKSTRPHKKLMGRLYEMCQDTTLDGFVENDQLFAELMSRMSKTREHVTLLNACFTHLNGLETPKSSQIDEYIPEEPDWILNGRIKWLKRITKGLDSLSDELNIPPTVERSTERAREINRKWMDISTVDHKLKGIRPIYAASDLYDACKATVDEAFAKNDELLAELRGHVPLDTLDEARSRFAAPVKLKLSDLNLANCLHARVLLRSSLRDEEMRPRLWMAALQAHVGEGERARYETLRRRVIDKELIADKLLILDVRSTAGNDDFYFVFEDFIIQTLLVFSRDETVAAVSKQALAGSNVGACYPPSQVLPFYGFSFYCAPLCFLFHDPILLFVVFKKMYLRYFIRLHTIGECAYYPPDNRFVGLVNRTTTVVNELLDNESDDSFEEVNHEYQGHGIIGLAHQFEAYFKERDPNLFQYLIKQEAHPVRIAFRWLIRAFAGFLPAAEVIYLWDFILAYDSLGIRVRFPAKSNENRHFTPVRRWRLHSTPRLLARRADGECD